MNYLKSEHLKFKRSISNKLLWIAPLITTIFAWIIGGFTGLQYFTFYWWYMFLLPGAIAILCSLSHQKEERAGKYYSVLSIPWMVLVTVISLFLKRGLKSIIIVIGFFTWMEIARLVRAETLSLKEREYVMYAKFVGVPGYLIILKHIVPAVLPTIIIASSTGIANAIMTESSLSFLGLGIQQPMSSWGSLLQNAQGNMQNAIYMAILPGLLIVLTIFAFNKLGNLLRIFVEPRVMSGEKD